MDDLIRLPGIRVLAPAWQHCLLLFLRQVYARSRSDNSVKNYLCTFTHFFAHYPFPERVTRAQVELFISTSFTGRGSVATNTRNNRLTALSAFYTYASTFLLPGNDGALLPLLRTLAPTAGIKRGKVIRTGQALSHSELERLFAVIPTDTVQGLRDRAIYLFYLYSARRRSEVARLRYGDIYYGTILDEQGKSREGWLYHFTGKGRAGEIDTAELSGVAKEALDRYLIASGRMDTITPDEPLFLPIGPRQGGGRPRRQTALSDYTIARNLKLYAAQAGLDVKKVHLHALRHSSAQAHYIVNPDIRSVQHLLRHQSSSTTDLYLRSLRGTADPALPALEKQFGHLSR